MIKVKDVKVAESEEEEEIVVPVSFLILNIPAFSTEEIWESRFPSANESSNSEESKVKPTKRSQATIRRVKLYITGIQA